MMRNWREAAALVAVSGRVGSGGSAASSLEVLLQTRPQRGSFKNSVVFPGGVCEQADFAPAWLHHFSAFGFSQPDFDSLHRKGTLLPPILQGDPVLKHVSLRITAIRETFEELGILVCSRQHKEEKKGAYAACVSDFDVKYWQDRVSKKPEDLLSLCTELKCYPDIWSLHYWSNWLSPVKLKKRFDTAFFLTALEDKPAVNASDEVVKVEWRSPREVLTNSKEVVLFPPQAYELSRIADWSDLEQLVEYAKRTSCAPEPLFYHALVRATDGLIAILPGDDLYPESIDYNVLTTIKLDKTVEEIRNASRVVHRIENLDGTTARFVTKNYKSKCGDMADKIVEVSVSYS